MTPREKAEDLIEKFMLWKFQKCELSKRQAKKIALIAVEELLKETEEIDGMRVINNPYWLEVRNEIEKL
jgi:hypothetical protein